MRTRDVIKRVTKSLVALGIVGGLGFGGYKWYQAAQAEPPVKPNPNTTAFSVSPAPLANIDLYGKNSNYPHTTYLDHQNNMLRQMWLTKGGHQGSGNGINDRYRIMGVAISNNTDKTHDYKITPRNAFVGSDGKLVYGGNSTLGSSYLVTDRDFDTQRLMSYKVIKSRKLPSKDLQKKFGMKYFPKFKPEYWTKGVTLHVVDRTVKIDQVSSDSLSVGVPGDDEANGVGDTYNPGFGHEYSIVKGSPNLTIKAHETGYLYVEVNQSLLQLGYSYGGLAVKATDAKRDVKVMPYQLAATDEPNVSLEKDPDQQNNPQRDKIIFGAHEHPEFDKQSLNVDKIKLVTHDSGKPYLQVNYSNHSNVAFQAHKVISYKIERKEQGKFKQVAVINDDNLKMIPSKVKTKRIIDWPEKTLRKGQYRITVQGLPGQMKRQVPKVWKIKITKEDSVQKTVRVNSAKLAWYHVTQKVYGWFN